MNVKVGQIWEDNDCRIAPGAYHRRFKVLEIVYERATVETINGASRKTKINLARFQPMANGYKLVQDVP